VGQEKKDQKIAKKRPKNSTFKPLSTIFVSCLKIQRGARPTAANAHASKLHYLWFDKAGSERSFCILAYECYQNHFTVQQSAEKKLESI